MKSVFIGITDSEFQGNETVTSAANYCRQPDNDEKPWCYTTDPEVRWQHCDIRPCTAGMFFVLSFIK